MDDARLRETLADLRARRGHEHVRSGVLALLVDGLGARLADLRFEQRVPEVQGRIDALFGRTVFEFKTDLRRESDDAQAQLARYLPERERATGATFVGVATDGATFRAYRMEGGALVQVGPDVAPDLAAPRALLEWLEGATLVRGRQVPDALAIRMQFGRESLAYGLARREIAALWAAAEALPDARLKRSLWSRLLNVAYGADIDEPDLFLQHTYLTILAKTIATLALTGALPADAAALMQGDALRARGVTNAVESDFFDWIVASPEGRALVSRIAAQADRFDFGAVEADLLKVLYESLIDPAQRHDLGEYYTPDWLAARIVRHAVRAPLAERVIDPACGSGTFLFHAMRHVMAAAEATGLTPAQGAERATALVSGIEIHPVAVIFARATCLLALAPALRGGHAGQVSLPVYLGDSLQWGTRPFHGRTDLEIEVPADGPHPRVTLRFPFDASLAPDRFDRLLESMLRFVGHGDGEAGFRRWLAKEGFGEVETLAGTWRSLKALSDAGRDHIWAYVSRNLARPLLLSNEGRRAHVVVGNPPWVAYRSMSAATQVRFKAEAKAAGVHVGGRFATANDLSALFFARAVDLYMRRDGRIAFVMPYAAMSRGPYEAFRRGQFKDRGSQAASVRFTEGWTYPAAVGPLFPVPACVLFAERSPVSRPLPATVTAHAGHLARRDADEAEADRALTATEVPWPDDDGTAGGGSPYRARFRQGATLVPRRLMLVEEVPVAPGDRLGRNPMRPLVRGRTGVQDKRPWKDLPPPEGAVEREFLHPVLLGESILPWRIVAPVLGVAPMRDGRLLDSGTALREGAFALSDWLRAAEGVWDQHKKSAMSFGERMDYFHLLTDQFPIAPLRVAFAASGVSPAAVVVKDVAVVLEHALYWATMATEDEAHYLCAILNSETARALAERWQSTGQWGARHFDRVVLNLPIPLFDARLPLHRALADAGSRAEALAAALPLLPAEHFSRARSRLRRALAEAGLSAGIDGLVADLLA